MVEWDGRSIRKVTNGRPKFRFMDLEIWQEAIAIGVTLFELADKWNQNDSISLQSNYVDRDFRCPII